MRALSGHSKPLSAIERREIIRRVAAGNESYRSIAESIGCSTKAIQRLMKRIGGVRRTRRSPLRLSPSEREAITRGLRAEDSMRAIARKLRRPVSTIAREIERNGGAAKYRAWRAEQRAVRVGRRPKPFKLFALPRLRTLVEKRLLLRWSPEQIAARLKQDFPYDSSMRVSHETIYRSLFVQGRGALRDELKQFLRRKPKKPKAWRKLAGRILDTVSIRARPAEVEDRALPGHWEGDLLIGHANKSAIGTLVERKSRYVMLFPLTNGRSAADVRRALAKEVMTLPAQLRKTLTWDRGHEMAEHVQFTLDTKVQVYFCDPYSPWQRGSNENTNGLLRQYFPKGTDFRGITPSQLRAVARELNDRPRETLGWKKPAEVFAEAVALTA